jgi:hypothetical protein
MKRKLTCYSTAINIEEKYVHAKATQHHLKKCKDTTIK